MLPKETLLKIIEVIGANVYHILHLPLPPSPSLSVCERERLIPVLHNQMSSVLRFTFPFRQIVKHKASCQEAVIQP